MLGASWTPLGQLLGALGRLLAPLGAPWAHLGRFLGAIARLLVSLGWILGTFSLPGTLQASFLEGSGTCRAGFGRP